MRIDDTDAATVVSNGWRQGSVLPPSLVRDLIAEGQIPDVVVPRRQSSQSWISRLRRPWTRAAIQRLAAKHLNPDSDLWMVISQDCDLLQYNWEKEPFAEIIRVRPAAGGKLPQPWGQNPREMQFTNPPNGKSPQIYVCSIHDRVRIDRSYLTQGKPDSEREIDPENVRRVCRWISRRYVRAAFPDQFNERAKAVLDRLAERKSDLDKHGELLTGVYIWVEDVELPIESPYTIIVWAAVRPRSFDDPDQRREAQKLLDQLEQSLAGCQGIEISECILKSEQEITLDHLRFMKRWDFDVLSLRPRRKNDPLPPVTEIPRED